MIAKRHNLDHFGSENSKLALIIIRILNFKLIMYLTSSEEHPLAPPTYCFKFCNEECIESSLST
jgi:hypothetical protein